MHLVETVFIVYDNNIIDCIYMYYTAKIRLRLLFSISNLHKFRNQIAITTSRAPISNIIMQTLLRYTETKNQIF